MTARLLGDRFMGNEHYTSKEILAAIDHDEIRQEAKLAIRAEKAKTFIGTMLLLGVFALCVSVILFVPYLFILEVQRRQSGSFYPPPINIAEMIGSLYTFSYVIIALPWLVFLLPKDNETAAHKVAANALQRDRQRTWEEGAPQRAAEAEAARRKVEQAERERFALLQRQRAAEAEVERERREQHVVRSAQEAASQADKARKIEATTIAKAVFSRLADFALSHTIQTGQRDHKAVAQMFAAQVLPEFEAQFGDRLGLTREADLAMLPANAELVRFLPNPPLYRIDRQYFPEDLREHMRIEYFPSANPENPYNAPFISRYVADKSQAVDLDDPYPFPPHLVAKFSTNKPPNI